MEDRRQKNELSSAPTLLGRLPAVHPDAIARVFLISDQKIFKHLIT
jgi:hypothetical protein